MNYRPHPFLLALFAVILFFNSLSVCLYGMLVGKRGVSAYELVHLIMSSISISAIFLLCAPLLSFVPTSCSRLLSVQWCIFAIYEAPDQTVQTAIYRHFLHDLSCKFSCIHQCISKGRPERSLFRIFFFSFESRLQMGWYFNYPSLGFGYLRRRWASLYSG